MNKNTNTTSEDVRTSVASLYSQLLNKRQEEKEAKREKRRQEEELREQEKQERKQNKDDIKLSKEERRAKELDNWKGVIIDLTGDDLEYSDDKKSKKKKYRKWIDDDNENTVMNAKPKKVKKRNYNKEFAPELQMLKNIVADQNKFNADLQKRFNTAAGPATKDAMPPNKTMVELAGVINAGRSNSLGVLKEIGNLKKVIADLYFKQRKEDMENGGASMGPVDMALMGSNIASSLFSDDLMTPIQQNNNPSYGGITPVNTVSTPIVTETAPVQNTSPVQTPVQTSIPTLQIESFDPATWDCDDIKVNDSVQFETIPHSVVVEMNQSTGDMRFKAISDNTGEELVGCPVPTYDPKNLKINEKDLTAKGQFDESYKLEII